MTRSLLPDQWPKIAPLLDAALDQPAAERQAFLYEACGADVALRAQLDALLADCARSAALLDAGAVEHFAPLLDEAPVTPPPLLAGRYRIERRIGIGGMASVHLARDLPHDRNVAIKVLNAELGAVLGADRFLAEIKLTANLHHPNVLPLFDSGAADGLLYYVMPFVDGESLRTRFARESQLAIDETLRIATSIANALDYAHARGVVHRDLKPENILLQAGQPILADFGIAIAIESAGGDRLTQTGISLGTPQYMSPEQGSGERVDARSDVYSLACVVYEMLTGEPPFNGPTPRAVIAKHLSERPPHASVLRDAVGPTIDEALQKAMAKAPADRYATAGQFVKALSTPTRGGNAITVRRVVTYLGALAVLGIGAGLVGRLKQTLDSNRAAAGASVTVPLTSYEGFETNPDISRDGKWVVFAWDQNGKPPKLFVVSATGGAPQQRTSGDDEDAYPVWSPDGQQIAFLRFRNGLPRPDIMVVPALGGSPRRVASSGPAGGLAWSPDGRWLAFSDRPDPGTLPRIFLLSLETGERHQLTRMPPSEGPLYDTDPDFSPDGRSVAFLRRMWGAGPTGDVYTQRLRDSIATRRTNFADFGWDVAWLDDNTLVFATGPYSGRHLVKVPLTGGQPQELAVGAGAWHISIARESGTLVYDAHFQNHDIWRVSGPTATQVTAPIQLIASTLDDISPAISPDGRQIAFVSARSGTWELWLAEADGSRERQLTNLGHATFPTWSLDGQAILFSSIPRRIKGTRSVVFSIDTSGGFPKNLTDEQVENAFPTVSSDGHWIYFQSHPDSLGWQLWRKPFGGGAEERVLTSPVLWPHCVPNGTIYFYRSSGSVWSFSGDGVAPRLVLKPVRAPEWTTWRNNVVFMRHTDTTTTIDMLDVVTGGTRILVSLPRFPAMKAGRAEEGVGVTKSMNVLSVSADGRWIAYSRLDRSGSDLMLVKGIR